MSDLALDKATGDLLLEGGRARLCFGAEAVAQAWPCHLTMFKGECFLDPSLGIDYQNEVLNKNPRPQVLRAIYGEATRDTPGVQDVSSLRFVLDPERRTLLVQAQVVIDGADATLTLAEPIGGS